MSLKLAARLVRIQGIKIADLQENDTTVHEEDLSAFLPSETIAIIFVANRASGAGNFIVHPNSHASIIGKCVTDTINTLPIQNRILKWKNSVANDDWDIYLFGYFVQKKTR